MGKAAPTRADLADVIPVPCARLGIQEGVASAEKLGCSAGDLVRRECERSVDSCGAEAAQYSRGSDIDHVDEASLSDEVDPLAKHLMNVTPVSFAEASKVRANLGRVAWVFQSSGGVALPTLLHPTIAVPQQHIRISHPVHLACPLSLINPRRGRLQRRKEQAGRISLFSDFACFCADNI